MTTNGWRRLFPATLALAACTACAREVLLPAADRLEPGTWGGDNVGVLVTDTLAHVHVGCTLGDFPLPASLDENGRFSVPGSYILRAYPVQVGPPLPAQFTGNVAGRTLTFTVAVNDTVEKKLVVLGPVTVTHGREPRMQVCPICAMENTGRATTSFSHRGRHRSHTENGGSKRRETS